MYYVDVPESLFPQLTQIDYLKQIDPHITSMVIPRNVCNYDGSSSFDLSTFSRLKWIIIGENNFYSVQTFRIDGLQRLRRLVVKNNSFAYIINTTNQNDKRIFHISNCELLSSIEIGNECFESVKTFKIDGLNRLKTIIIGNSSFTQRKNSAQAGYQTKSLHILNCASLESIQIGEYSFSDFAGGFELKNLPQLQSIQIGAVGKTSYNFCCCSLIIGGIDKIWNM